MYYDSVAAVVAVIVIVHGVQHHQHPSPNMHQYCTDCGEVLTERSSALFKSQKEIPCQHNRKKMGSWDFRDGASLWKTLPTIVFLP